MDTLQDAMIQESMRSYIKGFKDGLISGAEGVKLIEVAVMGNVAASTDVLTETQRAVTENTIKNVCQSIIIMLKELEVNMDDHLDKKLRSGSSIGRAGDS